MIDQVLARNFRGLSAADIHLDPCLTLVLGPNGSGKSSLCGAIEYALTGACEWTDGAGRGASVLVAHGSAGASVSVGGAQLGTIERQITAKGGSVACGARTGKEAEASLRAALPGSALLPAMLRAGALRFWISRLWDFYLPREASMLKPHDPTHFERVLQGRIANPLHA